MIGSDEMSSTGMDISESFRAEDLSKTDFFDFVTAPDMGIGIGVGVGVGVGVSLHSHAHSPHLHHQHHHHHQHHQNHHHHQQQQQQQQHQHQHNHQHSCSERTSASTHMTTHDGNSGSIGDSRVGSDVIMDGNNNSNGDGDGGNGNTSDPTLQGYEFWHTDKEQSRLESTIFEDLDRYCWQQQQQQQQTATVSQQQQHHSPATSAAAVNAATHPALSNSAQSPNGPPPSLACTSSNATSNPSTTTTHNVTSPNVSGSISQPSSTGTVSSIDNTDGQIYTLTVLNSNEPWLKREPDTQLPTTLDLDSLLGNFPGYIKSEYPYDDSGFSTDGTKDPSSDVNGLTLTQVSGHGGGGGGGVGNTTTGQNLPSLAISASGGGGGGGGSGGAAGSVGGTSTTSNLGQQLAQFQNNNNDWHMVDHNAEQNSAESLLRSALQGKGYSKGLHMQNGITLLPSSPSVKDDEMRRILFPTDADSLAFADSTLSAAQIFDETPNSVHNGGAIGHAGNSNSVSSIIVDDMFLSLENAFSDDFEKIKRIANEVQQFCTTTPTGNYGAGGGVSNDLMMQISPASASSQPLHSPTTPTPTGLGTQPHGPLPPPPSLQMQTSAGVAATQLPAQPLKPEVTTSSSSRISSKPATKKYKRSTSTTHAHNNNNNNNPNVINHNSNNNNSGNSSNINGGNSSSSAQNALSNSNSTNATGGNASSGSGGSNSSNSPTHCNGQRKERSLHYCSICSKGFKDKYSVNVHIRTHTGEKPFACSLCGKSFRQKAHLAKHYQTHMAQKNNGSIVKGASAKHHRSGASTSPSGSTGLTVAQHRQLSVATSAGALPTVSSIGAAALRNSDGSITSGGVTSGGGGMGIVIGTGISLNGPTLAIPTTTTSAAASILPPANGLLANR